jgi:glutathione peroxidase
MRCRAARGLDPAQGGRIFASNRQREETMLHRRLFLAAATLGLAAGATALSPSGPAHAGQMTAYDFAFDGIAGETVRLADWQGRPILVVNTASRCGFTHQYEGLQALYERYRERGLVVVGVPSDDFNQELSSNAEVKEFCAVNYAIEFPMTAITPVKGRSAHPFYVWAATEAGAPRWNFHKYLVGPDGQLAGAFPTATDPTAPEVTARIESLLAGS